MTACVMAWEIYISLFVARQDFVREALLTEKEGSCKSVLLFEENPICTSIKYRSQ